MSFQSGDTIYIVENNHKVTPASVVRFSGGFYTLRLSQNKVIRLSSRRVFRTREEAEHTLPESSRTNRPDTAGRFSYNPRNHK